MPRSVAMNPFGLPAGVDDRAVFQALFAAYPDAILVVDKAGSIMMANPSAAALFGFEPPEMLGLSVDELVPEGIRPRHAAYRNAYATAPKVRPMGNQMDLRAKRKDGSEVTVEIALSPLQQDGLPFVVVAIRDVAAYPRVKQALKQARYSDFVAQFGRLAVDARDPKVLVDQVPRIAAEALQVESALVVVLEDDETEFRITSGIGLLPGEQVGGRIANLPDTPPGYLFRHGQSVIVADFRDENRFAVPEAFLLTGLRSAVASPLSDRGRIVGALSVRSTEVARFGKEELTFLEGLSNVLASSLQRAKTEEALNHAQRLESVGQLTGGMAHDFNNLLTVIQGNLQVLGEQSAIMQDPYAPQLVSAATRAARRGAELTSKLLAFSRRQVLQPTAVNVATMLGSLADMLTRTFDQRVRIEVSVQRDCPPVQADPGQLESALLNIAINARDAMPDGGTLRFVVEACESLPAFPREQLADAIGPSSRYVSICVQDTGCGMSEAVMERAFEPFFTTKEAGRGTGLGLSTVYGFARQSHGAATIDSVVGNGTQVTLYIPCPEQTDVADDPDDRPLAPLAQGLRVLLVEDDSEVRTIIRTFLTGLECEVVGTASSAEQALMLLDSHVDVELLLSDIALGSGMRGTELATQAQRMLPHLAILLMSGFSEELLEADRDSPSSWQLLSKPCSREELAQAMASAMASRVG